MRSQIDYVFIFKENIESTRIQLYNNYAGCFPTFESFCDAMDRYTEDFGCLVIRNAYEDNVFWYKAESHGSFRMGADKLWPSAEAAEASEVINDLL